MAQSSMKVKLLCGLWLCLFIFPLFAQGREIIDMSGRKVTIPETISKVVAVSPPGTYLLYAIDPGVIAGLNFPLWENEKQFTLPGLKKLPVIGGLVGQGRTLNREVLLQVKPDFVLFWTWRQDAINRKFAAVVDELGLPRVCVRLDSIDDYPAALGFLGEVLGKKERGRQLTRYADDALREAKAIAAQIPAADQVRVYYAGDQDGLGTERSASLHAELIPLTGGINVHQGEELDHYGMEKISMEQLLLYDPQVILVKEKSFYGTVFTDGRWQNLRAVRDKRVYLIPYVPFNWFDRPPSFMRLLGIKWLLHTLHPDLYRIDLNAETRAFYKLFLGVDLSRQQAEEILHP
jgi:iron complex transport system substrate-binding protein